MATGVVLGRLRMGPTGSAVRFELRYGTAPADLWWPLIMPERLGRWLTPVDGDLVLGGEVRLYFGPETVATIMVAACRPERSLDLRYGFPDGAGSRLRVDLRPDGDGTIMTLDHSGLPGSPATYAAAWQVNLDLLGGELVGGDVDIDRVAVYDELVGHYAAAWARLATA
jgi:uncharacterized protein YndB with AHSA1/START domain